MPRTSVVSRVALALIVLSGLSACKLSSDAASSVADLPANDQNVAAAQAGFQAGQTLSFTDLPTNILGPTTWGCTESTSVQGNSTQTTYGLSFAQAFASDVPVLPAVAQAKLVYKDPPPASGEINVSWLDGNDNTVSSHVYVPLADGLVSEGFLVPTSAQGHVVDVVRMASDKSAFYIEHSVAPGDLGGGQVGTPSLAPGPAAAGFVAESYSVCHVDETKDKNLILISGEYEGCGCTTDSSQPFISFSRRTVCHTCCDDKWNDTFAARFGSQNQGVWESDSGVGCYNACDQTFSAPGVLQSTFSGYCPQSLSGIGEP